MDDLSQAKVGDLLFIAGRFGGVGRLLKIERITLKGRVITKHSEFDPSGRLRGARGYDVAWARLATPEDIKTIKRAQTVSILESFCWDKLTEDDLDAVHAIANKYNEPSKP